MLLSCCGWGLDYLCLYSESAELLPVVGVGFVDYHCVGYFQAGYFGDGGGECHCDAVVVVGVDEGCGCGGAGFALPEDGVGVASEVDSECSHFADECGYSVGFFDAEGVQACEVEWAACEGCCDDEWGCEVGGVGQGECEWGGRGGCWGVGKGCGLWGVGGGDSELGEYLCYSGVALEGFFGG